MIDQLERNRRCVVGDFDPGYGNEPYLTLCRTAPGDQVYPSADFRTEWGPIFHRGRLDGTARVLIVGQDPATAETFTRRILVGTAGKRTQGFLAKLGITRSYLLINAFLYSVYGQTGGQHHANDSAIAQYRNKWLDAIAQHNSLDAVVALGALADGAVNQWPGRVNYQQAYAHITHPTEPESSSGGDPQKLSAATAALLSNWNIALAALRPKIAHPDTAIPKILYGATWAPGDLVDIPDADLPAGIPAWMGSEDGWSVRTGATGNAKRRTLTITVPTSVLPTPTPSPAPPTVGP